MVWLYRNWKVPGLQVAAIGVTLNTIAVLLHGGKMPVFEGSLIAAGLTAADLVGDPFHVILAATSTAEFVRQGGMFGDVVPIPVPVLRDVISVGDVLLWLGIVWAIAAAMTRREAPSRVPRRWAPVPPDRCRPASSSWGWPMPPPWPSPPRRCRNCRVRASASRAGEEEEEGQSPYLRLATNRNYALLWSGQLVSLMGDRIHQIALGYLVATRGTPLEVGFTFAAIAIPNIIFGPWAGALADRWDRRRTMIGADLIRAVLVLLVPLAINMSITLVYVVAFLVATRGAPLPSVQGRARAPDRGPRRPDRRQQRDQRDRDPGRPRRLSIGRADGRRPGGHHRYRVRPRLGDVPHLRRAPGAHARGRASNARWQRPLASRQLWRDVREGVSFLAHQAELRANTLVSTVGQVAVGTEVTCSLLYAQTVLDQSVIGFPQNYALLMAAIGLGSIVGGLVIGGLAGDAKKGPMVIAGFIGMGASFIVAGLVTDPVWAIGLFFLIGATNMAFVIPNITLFQERTPQALFARVVTSRQALVFGVMAAAMAVSGVLAGIIGADRTLMLGGAVAVVAGLIGILIPSMRNAA